MIKDFFENRLKNVSTPCLNNLIYLSNDNTLEYLYNIEPNDDLITIYHTMRSDMITKFFLILQKYYNIKFERNLLNLISREFYFIIKFNSIDYRIFLKYQEKCEDLYPLGNLNFDLYKFELYQYKNGENILIENLDNFIESEIINENFIQVVISNYFILFELIYGLIRLKEEKFKDLIDRFIDILDTNKKIRKNVRHEIELGKKQEKNTRIYNLLLKFDNNSIGLFNKLTLEHNIINKILYDLDIYCDFGINVDDFEEYIVLILINKLKIINKNYYTYAKIYIDNSIKKDKQVISDITNDVDNYIINDVEDDVEDDVANDITNDVANDVANDITNDITNDVANDVANDIKNDVANDIKNDVANDIVNDVDNLDKNENENHENNNVEDDNDDNDRFDNNKMFSDILMNDFFTDKITDYRNMKEYVNNIDINKYLLGLESRKVFFIKNCLLLLGIMFYHDFNIKYNFESMRLGYLIKKFSYLKEDFMKKSLKIYNKILIYLNLDNSIDDNNFFYKLCFNKKLLFYEVNKTCELPIIIKKYHEEEDIIDMEDFQDIFILLYDFLFKNKLEIEDLDINDLNLYFESQLSNYRSNKMIKLNSKRKKRINSVKKDDTGLLDWLGLCTDEINVINSIIGRSEKSESIEDYLIDNLDKDKNKNNHNINSTEDSTDDLEYDFAIDYEEDYEDVEDDEDDENQYGSKSVQIKNMIYKLKYERYKISYIKLKFVDQIISRNDFDVEILDGSNGLNEELIEKLLTKYNMKINLADESSETE
jgi:hypothetical protein